jgi:hypothetical protein
VGPSGYSVSQIIAASDDELRSANSTVNDLWGELQKQQSTVTDLQQRVSGGDITQQATLNTATNDLAAKYQAYSQALQRVETANAGRAKTLNDAIHNGTVDPSQVEAAKATADKAIADGGLANTQAKVLLDGADTQKALVAAQAAASAQQGLLAKAQADAVNAKTPAEKAQLEAQAAALSAQAKQTLELLPGLKDKQAADTNLTIAQTGLTDANSDLTRANTASVNADAALKQAQLAAGLPAAQVAATQGQGAQSQAAAAASQAQIEQGKQGPLYGLQDQLKIVQGIDAIRQQIFGPGGSGDPAHANDLLKQFMEGIPATLAGTTPYAANVAAANAGLTAFGTQASLANAAQAAAASRANAYTGFGSNALSSLLGVMKDAPAGSQLLGTAFNDVMNQMSARTAQGQYAPPTQPTAPQLPALLQKLAPGPSMPSGPPLPGPAAAPVIPQQPQQPQTSAPITINVGGGQPQGVSQQTTPGFNMGAMPGAGPQGQQSSQLPSMLQNYAPPTTDFVHQLWGNELGSGAVRSPYAAMGQGG